MEVPRKCDLLRHSNEVLSNSDSTNFTVSMQFRPKGEDLFDLGRCSQGKSDLFWHPNLTTDIVEQEIDSDDDDDDGELCLGEASV